MKKRGGFRKFLITILSLLILSFLGMNFVKKQNYYERADRKFFSNLAMVRYALIERPIKTVTSVSEDLATMWDLRYENERLQRELASYRHLASRNEELESEVQELKEILELDELFSEYELIPTVVETRSIDKWDQAVTIGVGSREGVEVGDGVIHSKGLVGKVIEVSEHKSLVSLITANDEHSKVAVKIQVGKNKFTPAILNDYNFDENVFTLKLLESKSSLVADMPVLTSGQGGVFPSGLYVGKINSVENVADSLGVLAYLETDVDFNDLKYVSVVKK